MPIEYEYEPLRERVVGSRPALSPFALIQEMAPSRWAALVGAVLCVKTGRAQSHLAAWSLLARWRTPAELFSADVRDLADVVRPAGLVGRRVETLLHAAAVWSDGIEPGSVRRILGVGKYVETSDIIFGCGILLPQDYVEDHVLRQFVGWAADRRAADLPWRVEWKR